MSSVSSTVTSSIVNEFSNIIDADQEYTLKEMKQILSDIYKTKTDKKSVKKTTTDEESLSDDSSKVAKRGRPSKSKVDSDGNAKAKKKPTAYNIFMKKMFPAFKEQNTDKNAKEIMIMLASEWKSLSNEEKEKYKSVEDDNE